MAINANIGTISVKVTSDTSGVRKGERETVKSLNNTEKALKSNEKQWGVWSSAVKLAATAALAVAAAKTIQYSDAMTSINNKLKLATKSTEDFERVTKALFQTANDTRSSVEATVDLYAKMERSTRTLGVSQERLLKITGSINKAFAISGATTAETSGSIRQLGQALASGALRGDEFNSIAEQAPIIMEAVSAATGKTAGELRKLAAEGLITADVLIKSLEGYADTIDGEFSTATATFTQKMEVAGNQAIAFVGANDAINAAVSAAGDAIVFTSENLDTFTTVIGIAGIAIASKFVTPLVASRVALLVTGAASLKAAGSVGVLTAAATASRAALAFLGGPVGILITVAASLATFVDWESDAEKQLIKTNKKINEQVSSIKGLSAAQLELENANFDARMRTNLKAVSDVNIKIKEAVKAQRALLESYGQSTMGVKIQNTEIIKLRAQLKLLLQDQERLQKIGGAIFEAQLAPKIPTKDSVSIDLDAAAQVKQDEKDAKKLAKLQEQEAAQRAIKAAAAEATLTDLRKTFATESELEDIFHEEQLTKLDEAMQKRRELGVSESIIEAEGKAIELELIKAHEAAKTDIEAEESMKRIEQAKRERMQKIENIQLAGNAILAVNSIFGSKSKAAQKKQRKAEVAINTAAGVARAFAEHDFYSALGISAILVANAKKQISSINSETVAGVSGGSTSSVSAPQQQQSQSNQPDKVITAKFVGEGSMSQQGVRNLIEQFNEAIGDGATLNVVQG